jgi:hypothetical protein
MALWKLIYRGFIETKGRGWTLSGGAQTARTFGRLFIFTESAWLLIFPGQNGLHQLAWIDFGVWQRPMETFRRGELARRAGFVTVTPQGHKTADGPGSSAQSRDLVPSNVLAHACRSQIFGALDEPFYQDARFHVAQAARQGVVVEDLAQEPFRQHRLPPQLGPHSPGHVRAAALIIIRS